MGRTAEKIEQLENEIKRNFLLQEQSQGTYNWHLYQHFIDLAEAELDFLTNVRCEDGDI